MSTTFLAHAWTPGLEPAQPWNADIFFYNIWSEVWNRNLEQKWNFWQNKLPSIVKRRKFFPLQFVHPKIRIIACWSHPEILSSAFWSVIDCLQRMASRLWSEKCSQGDTLWFLKTRFWVTFIHHHTAISEATSSRRLTHYNNWLQMSTLPQKCHHILPPPFYAKSGLLNRRSPPSLSPPSSPPPLKILLCRTALPHWL